MTNRTTSFVTLIIWLIATGLCAAVLTLAGTFLYLDPQIPSAASYRNVKLETPLRIYSEDNALLAEFGTRRVIPVVREEIPPLLISAVLDTEDKRFYSHRGIDLISLLNDVIELAITQKISSGASTITMQLAKNVSFSLEQTFIRKFKEMLLALKIEQELTKDEILTLYLNVVPFGKRAYGVQAASLTYYGKPLDELNLPQFAMLAGIPQAPEAGNPINGPERALRRRNVVLGLMLSQESITREAYEEAIEAPITARVHRRELDLNAPYLADWVRQQALERYPDDLYTGGYEIFTTINSRLQKAAVEAVRKGLIGYDRNHGYRGAEQQFDLADYGFSSERTVEDVTGDDVQQMPEQEQDVDPLETLLAIFTSYPERGGLQAALVTGVAEQTFSMLLANGEIHTMPWEGMSWARLYVDVNSKSRSPSTASDVVHEGDLVRVYRLGDTWRLTQLPEVQGALISLDPNNGKIRAIVGGFDFRLNQFNHALQATRQPGSGLKPFVYSAAIAHGVTPSDIFMDAPLVFSDSNLETIYRPKNDGGRYNGPTRLREALYRSINLVSMRVLLKVGAGRVLRHLSKFGFDTSNFPRNTQLAIGGGTIEVTPLQMATAFSVLANEGFRIEPNIITEVRRQGDGSIFRPTYPLVCNLTCEEETAQTLPKEAVVSVNDETQFEEPDLQLAESDRDKAPQEATPLLIPAQNVVNTSNVFIVNSMLQDVIRRGTGRRANRAFKRRDLSGKTGTTNEADTWFNGYNRNLVTTTWVGFSDGRPLGDGEYGSNRPLPIWIDYMQEALKDTPDTSREQPENVVSLKIDPQTGERARPGQSNAIFEYFLKEFPPRANSGSNGSSDNGDEDQIVPDDIF